LCRGRFSPLNPIASQSGLPGLNEPSLPCRLLADLDQGKRAISTRQRIPDICQTPAPLWSLIDLKQYDSMSVQFRGLPFQLRFLQYNCPLGHRRAPKPRINHRELDGLYALGWRRNISLSTIILLAQENIERRNPTGSDRMAQGKSWLSIHHRSIHQPGR